MLPCHPPSSARAPPLPPSAPRASEAARTVASCGLAEGCPVRGGSGPAHGSGLADGASPSPALSPTARVLQEIKQAQAGPRADYQQALHEIKTGEKLSCWIWYVWPCLAPVRETSRPQFSLPDLDAAYAYLQDDVLRHRLHEITREAVAHLSRGVRPFRLLGGATDAQKFHETMTCFAVVALEASDSELARIFLDALHGVGWPLEKKTIEYISGQAGMAKYSGLVDPDQLENMLRGGGSPKKHAQDIDR